MAWGLSEANADAPESTGTVTSFSQVLQDRYRPNMNHTPPCSLIGFLLVALVLPLSCTPVSDTDLPTRPPAGDDDVETPVPTSSPLPTPEQPVDADRDGSPEDLDCNDADASIYPGADEICDLADNDCDGLVDEESEQSIYYTDNDGDGYGMDTQAVKACQQPEGTSEEGGDCDDGDPLIHPNAEERCNGIDDDCDGQSDEDSDTIWYPDLDGDGFGTSEDAIEGCPPSSNYAQTSGDCDDTDPNAYPGAYLLYPDQDADGFGAADSEPEEKCELTPGWAPVAFDCDDWDAAVAPVLVDIVDGSLEGEGSADFPFKLINDAVESPGACRRILVNPGTYTEAVVIDRLSDLELIGVAGAMETFLETSGGYRPLYIASVSGLLVQGLHLSSSAPVDAQGGAVLIEDSTGITLRELQVEESSAEGQDAIGGGIAVTQASSVLIEDSLIRGNSAVYGGGIAVEASEVSVRGSWVDWNYASDSGGGLAVGNLSGSGSASLVIESTMVADNVAEDLGGGAVCEAEHNLEVYDSDFERNSTSNVGWGGGLYNAQRIVRTTFTENSAFYAGGVQMIDSGSVQNSFFLGNTASYGGGLNLWQEGDLNQEYYVGNNTFVDNEATGVIEAGAGASILVYYVGSIALQNNVITHFTSDAGCAVSNWDLYLDYTVDHNDVYTLGETICGYAGFDAALIGRDGNISDDPLFVSYSTGEFYDVDLHLQTGSPAIDSANPEVGTDPDGSMPDMGAYGGPNASQ